MRPNEQFNRPPTPPEKLGAGSWFILALISGAVGWSVIWSAAFHFFPRADLADALGLMFLGPFALAIAAVVSVMVIIQVFEQRYIAFNQRRGLSGGSAVGIFFGTLLSCVLGIVLMATGG